MNPTRPINPKTPSKMAHLIAEYRSGSIARPALAPCRKPDQDTVFVMTLRDGDLYHAVFKRDPDGTIHPSKNDPHGHTPVTGLDLNTAGRALARSLAEDLATLTGMHPQNAAQLISELCSTNPDKPAKTKLNARAMHAEEMFQAKLVDADVPTKLLRSIQAPQTLNAYNALVHCHPWFQAALATHPHELAQYFRNTVNLPEMGRPYPKSPKDLTKANRRHHQT